MIISYAGLILCLLVPTGFMLWWRTKRASIHWNGSWFRICFDAHHTIGIYASVFLWIAAFAGALIGFDFAEKAIYSLTHSSRPSRSRPPQSMPTPGATVESSAGRHGRHRNRNLVEKARHISARFRRCEGNRPCATMIASNAPARRCFCPLLSCLPATLERGSLPDPKLTPGDTLGVTKADICTPGYTKLVRAAPAAVKRQVYAAYRRSRRKGICCEVDHLISLELGGSNRLNNLWPAWNAHVKDRLENRLHELVCTGQLDLATAQRAIATDWI
jgi:PepSY-associated TM region